MNTYNSLYLELAEGNISNIDKPLIPVNIGDCFYDQKGRKCEVVELKEKAFRYIFLNPSLETPNIKKWMNYSYRNSVKWI
jgi:hypothetical protein